MLQTKSIPPALQYRLLDCKTALENGWGNSGHSYQLSWPVGMRTLGRQIGVLQQFTVLDGLNPSPALSPAVLPSHMATWPCPRSSSCIPSYLVYPSFACRLKNSRIKESNEINPLKVYLQTNNTAKKLSSK